MSRLTIAAQTIKDSVSALDVGRALGLEIRHGRCKCPIHDGGDFNCVLYPGDRGYYCHVCHQGGDVISLVQHYYGTSFKKSVTWFNDTFGLGLNLDSPMSPEALKQAEEARKKREEERAEKERKEREEFDLALNMSRLVEKLEDQRDKNVPRTPDEEWSSEFCEAIERLPGIRAFAIDCMMNCNK